MPLTLLSFHHFYSSKKLAALQTLTRSLPTSALYLQGRPGALLISSTDTTHLHAYVKAVKRMRWQKVHNLGTSESAEHRLELPMGVLAEVEGRIAGLVLKAGELGGVGVEEWVRGKVRVGFGNGLKG